MFKNYQDTSSADQFKGFPNLNFQGSNSAYGFSGVSFWLDAAFGLSTQTNLGRISRWQPRIGREAFIQNTAGNQPRLILNDPNYNNFPSVESDDNGRFMTSGSGFDLNGGNCTLVIVSKINTGQRQNIIFSSTGGIDWLLDGGSDGGYTGFGILFNSTNFQIQGTTESTNTRIKIMLTNNLIINGSAETPTGNISGYLRRYDNLFSNARYQGSLAEVIVYNYVMTQTDAIALSDRINQKYVIY